VISKQYSRIDNTSCDRDSTEMSVKTLDFKEALAIIDDARNTGPTVTKNFFNVFGTTGCLLNCKFERTLDADLYNEKARYAAKNRREKKKVTSARKIQISQFRESRQTWSTASAIRTSATQGCASCNIIRLITIAIFFPGVHELPDEYEYSIAQDFEVRYRRIGEEEPVAIIQLFQPPGKRSALSKI
jgi:hypothetical protein